MQFWKMNGAGNDFIILNNLNEHLPQSSFPLLARTLCERHLSIGADGLMVVDAPTQGGDYRMWFYNSDGSLGEMCGNGARCICRYGYENRLAGEIQTVETTAGLVTGLRIDRRLYRIRLNDPTTVQLDIPIEIDGVRYTGSYLELGNPGLPHAVIPYHDLAQADENELRELGRAIRHYKAFPKGANVNFYELTGEDEVARLGETFDVMAESVEKDRDLERRLTTDVAHELRTPLMAIQATVEAMIDGVYEADEERLVTVNSEIQRLSRLVNALLKLSRLENRAEPMKEEVVNVGELISGIVATHEMFVSDSGLTLEYDAEPDVMVVGDADMIRQATANLISNAVRYTPEGGHITVSVQKGDIMASIAVRDTGIGLTKEEARMVFSRFWRADAGRNRESGGLGVGLSVVKEIVDRHGGWVQVEGEKGKGACFTIHIPLYDEDASKHRRNSKKRTGHKKPAKASR